MDECAPVSSDVDDDELVAAAEEIEEARKLVDSALMRIRTPDSRSHAWGYVATAYSKLTLADASINNALKIRGVQRKEQTERVSKPDR